MSDKTLLLAAFIHGKARWEPFNTVEGELCFDGCRYSTTLDANGIPLIYKHIRDALIHWHTETALNRRASKHFEGRR